jgi:lipopolysaccharide/colanic/teichoic acid biosynthesis glycosyltransferase
MTASRTGLVCKRTLDITVSAVGLVVTAPVQLALAGVVATRLETRQGREGV